MPENLLIRLGLCALVCLSLLGCPTEDDDDSADGDDDDDTTTQYEEGCILINGIEPGYAHLADALLMAQDGDNLTVCPGDYMGSVTIGKSVSIIGVSSNETVIVGDLNEMAVTITAPDVTLAHLTISSTRNGIVAEGATGLVLDDVIISDSGQYGISVSDSEVSITGSQLSLHPFGAIDAQNSVLTVTSSEITDIEGYGIRLVESTADISNTIISNVTVPEASDDTDGTCIYSENASGPITLDTVMMDHCLRVGVYWFDSDVEASGCSITESNYGFIGIRAADDRSVLTANTLTDVPFYGIYVIEQDSEISGNTIVATNAMLEDSIGIAVGNPDGELVVTDNHVEGYALYSIWVQYPYDPEPTGGTAVITGNTVTEGQLFGLYVSSLDEVTFTGNTVDGLYWSGEQPQANTYDTGMGMGLFDIDSLTMSGNLVSNVDVVGMFINNCEFTSDGDELTDTKMWGMYINESSGTFTNFNAHDVAIYGADIRTSDVDFDSSVFTGFYEAIDPGNWENPEAYAYPTMAVVYNDAQGTISNSSFTDNDDYGVYISEGDVTVQTSTFEDNYYGVYVYGSQSGEGYPIHIEDNDFGDHAYAAVTAYTTDGTISGNTFTGATGYGVYGGHFSGALEDNEFTSPGTCVQMYGYDASYMTGTGTIANNTFNGCDMGVYAYYLSGDLEILDNTFDSVRAPIDLADWTPSDATVVLQGNHFTSSGSTAIDLSSLLSVDISGDNVIDGTTSGAGVLLASIEQTTIDGLTVSGTASDGLSLSGTGIYSVSNSSLSSTGASGILASGSSMELTLTDNVAISDNTTQGIYLSGTLTGTVVGNTISGNGEFGMRCDSSSVSLGQCFNTMSGNVLGDFLEENGCVLGCTAIPQ